jgi:predicted Zn-dependent protease
MTFISNRYKEAEELYNEILEEHPGCSSVWKRKVAILKHQGKAMEAIKELNEFLLM